MVKRRSYFHKIKLLFILIATAALYSCTGFFNCGSFPFENPNSCKQVEDTNLVTPIPEPPSEPPADETPPDTPDQPTGPSEPTQEPDLPTPELPISDDPSEPPTDAPEVELPEKELPETNLPVVTTPEPDPPVTGVDLCTWYEEPNRTSNKEVGETCGCVTDWEGNRFNQVVISPGVCGSLLGEQN